MRVAFRVDASSRIGSGHAMRCLALAEEWSSRKTDIDFICASIPDALARRIQDAGYALHRIEQVPELRDALDADAQPLSASAQERDAALSLTALEQCRFDWVVVDHYALDARWCTAVGKGIGLRLIVDDLANRRHDCELLLDQTFGRTEQAYRPLVPEHCALLLGPEYALLRSEFAQARPIALERRRQATRVRRLLIALGGSDVGGITLRVLEATVACGLSCDIDVVLGAGAPSKAAIERLAADRPNIALHVDTDRMASLMTEADLAVGASGISSWERCCLGLPALALTLAANQRLIAEQLDLAGAQRAIESFDSVKFGTALLQLAGDDDVRRRMSATAALITDGKGAMRVVDSMFAVTGAAK